MRKILKIEGVTCSACARAVERAAKKFKSAADILTLIGCAKIYPFN